MSPRGSEFKRNFSACSTIRSSALCSVLKCVLLQQLGTTSYGSIHSGGNTVNLKNGFKLMLASAVMVLMTACSVSFTTSHLSSLIVSKEKDSTTTASAFGPHETVYAKGVVSNVSGKVTLQWHLIAEKVVGQADNFAIAGLDKSFELAGDGNSSYDLSPPDAGWPVGKYRIELHMLVESGEDKDMKSSTFTVTGG